MNPLIHIGYPKTSTTWFQKQFYPRVTDACFIGRDEVLGKILRKDAFSFNPAVVSEYFTDHCHGRILICEEEILVDRRNNGIRIAENARRINAVFPQADIVVIIRNQTDIMASRYSQHILAGGTHSPDRYLFRQKTPYKNVTNDFILFEYDKVVTLYQNLFGTAHVHVFLFEQFAADNTSFLKEYCRIFDLKINLDTLSYQPENPRLRKALYPLARFMNIFTREKYAFKYYVIHIPGWYQVRTLLLQNLNRLSIMGSHPSSREVLGWRSFRFIEDYYRESNKTLSRMLPGLPLADHGYPM